MDEPRIEFPCDYPIKVIVQMGPDVVDEIIHAIKKYDAKITRDLIEQNPSKNGNYVSLRYQLWATGKPQLEKLFSDLKQNKAVRMVL